MTHRQYQRVGASNGARALKGVLDRLVAAAGLIVLSPLFVATAVAIRVSSPGPVFYRQERAGLRGVPFSIFKFRTMIDGAERVGLRANVAHDDDRITRVGRWLRLTSFDEVPQLINVFIGHMSVVGPRPAPIAHASDYSAHQRRRLEVKPGITGWAQVNGRNSLSWEDRIDLDIWYIDHWSLGLDVRILLRTPLALINRDGLYGPNGVTTDLDKGSNAEESSGDVP